MTADRISTLPHAWISHARNSILKETETAAAYTAEVRSFQPEGSYYLDWYSKWRNSWWLSARESRS